MATRQTGTGDFFEAFSEFIKKEIEEAVEKKMIECLPEALRRARQNPTMSNQEVMQALRIKSYDKLRTLRNNGTLSYIKDGGQILYPTESVEKYLEERTIKGKF